MPILVNRLEKYKITSLCAVLLFLFCLSVLAGCEKLDKGSGVVATVNGEPISLNSLQMLMDSRSGAMGIPPRPSVAEMKSNYGRALGVLIAHALVRQDLAQRGIEISQGEVDRALADVHDDLGEATLDSFMKDAAISREAWLNLMRDYLALETFRSQVLLAGIKIDKNEVRDYFRAHRDEFSLPERMHVCMATASSREDMESWLHAFAAKEESEAAMTQCVDVQQNELPQDWLADLRGLKPGSCAKPRNDNDEWQTICLVSREGRRQLPLGEVYALIERTLLAEKQSSAFDEWLEQKLKNSDIKVVPELNDCLAMVKLEEATGDSADNSTSANP